MENTDTTLIVALVSTIAFILYSLVAGVFADIGHHGSAGGTADSGWGLFEFISIQAILLAVMGYSWSWLFWQIKTPELFIQIVATFLSGTALVVLYAFGMRLITRLNSPDTIEGFVPAVGMHGVVYLTIPAFTDGMGSVTFMDSAKGDFQINATSESGTEIDTGTAVVVTDVNLPSSVTVRKV